VANPFDQQYDVIVAGGGGAGLMAAIAAAEAGARVLLIEKFPELGGATRMAVGSISASGTEMQKVAGIIDDVDSHLADYLGLIPPGRIVDDYYLKLTRIIIDRASYVLQRLIDFGLEFTGPHPESPHRVPRMHNVVPDASAFIATLGKVAESKGVTIETGIGIDGLLKSDDGQIVGVTLRESDTIREASVKAVVLTTGYFGANDEMARRFGRSPEVSDFDLMVPSGTGDGITAAEAVGAATAGMYAGGTPTFRTVTRPHSRPEPVLFREGAVLVNRDGRRFTNELSKPELATNQQRDQVAYMVFDDRLAAKIATADDDTDGIRNGWHRTKKLFLSTFPEIAYAYIADYRERTDYFFESDTVEGLADNMGIPADSLMNSITSLNRAANGEQDDEFRHDPVGPGISRKPFYAVGPLRPGIGGSEGGIKVNTDMRVLDTEGNVIVGLFGAGATAMSGALLAGHGHALVWAFATGEIAGRNAAAEA